MKNLILLFVGLLAAVYLYQKFDNDNSMDQTRIENAETILVNGKVVSNLSIMGQSVYELVSIPDTTKYYFVLVKGQTPAIGAIRKVRLAKYDIFSINDNHVSIYMEQPESNWLHH